MKSTSIEDKRKDILKIIESLDMTPTMYNNAVEKYNAIVQVLENNGIQAHIYPQGSFAIGTVVKPKTRKRNADYDLDVICEANYNKKDITPAELYEKIEDVLSSDGRYSSKLEYFDECITINYSDVNGIGFSIDLVPSVHEDLMTINSMRSRSEKPSLCDTAIAITTNRALDWGSSNPKGYQTWFQSINQKFIDYEKNTNIDQLLLENRKIFASADKIPKSLIKTPLQRVIQLLKSHNNEFFDKPHIKDFKVKSIIIATIVAKIAEEAPEDFDTFELLGFVIKKINIYTYLFEDPANFIYSQESLIRLKEGKWVIDNPSNPDDNLADSWNDNADNCKYFCKWLKAAISDFEGNITGIYESKLLNIFGASTLSSVDVGKEYVIEQVASIDDDAHAKPWRTYGS